MLPRAHKGRGATLNPDGRFERLSREAVDDGWGSLDELADDPAPATQVLPDRARTIIAHNDSPDIPFDQSINPYRGCEHGCVYCYARPSHGHLGLSAGLDFETKIFVKHEAAALLRQELARPGYVCKPISLGANTDPYQPLERRLRITRQVLEVLAEARHPVGIVTKSALVTRDIDLLAPMAREGLARVYVSVTTLDGEIARTLEPRASAPHRRLAAIRALAAAGVTDRRDGGPDHPGADRPRDRADPRGRGGGRGGQRRLRPGPAAARGEGPDGGLAGGALSRAAPPTSCR